MVSPDMMDKVIGSPWRRIRFEILMAYVLTVGVCVRTHEIHTVLTTRSIISPERSEVTPGFNTCRAPGSSLLQLTH